MLAERDVGHGGPAAGERGGEHVARGAGDLEAVLGGLIGLRGAPVPVEEVAGEDGDGDCGAAGDGLAQRGEVAGEVALEVADEVGVEVAPVLGAGVGAGGDGDARGRGTAAVGVHGRTRAYLGGAAPACGSARRRRGRTGRRPGYRRCAHTPSGRTCGPTRQTSPRAPGVDAGGGPRGSRRSNALRPPGGRAGGLHAGDIVVGAEALASEAQRRVEAGIVARRHSAHAGAVARRERSRSAATRRRPRPPRGPRRRRRSGLRSVSLRVPRSQDPGEDGRYILACRRRAW